MKMRSLLIGAAVVLLGIISAGPVVGALPSLGPLTSYDTGYTIIKVRTADNGGTPVIIGSSYEGTVIAMDYEGTMLWTNALSGYMNHDLWCADVTGDGVDEILAANADGSVYCLNASGRLLWQFKPDHSGHEPPMYSVCTIRADDQVTYVVCGGFDTRLYYLTPSGGLVKSIQSTSYATQNLWYEPWGNAHLPNFIRPVHRSDGTQDLAVVGSIVQIGAWCRTYLFEPLADHPFQIGGPTVEGEMGDFRAVDLDGDGNDELLMGQSNQSVYARMAKYSVISGINQVLDLGSIIESLPNSSGYLTIQAEPILEAGITRLFVLMGANIMLRSTDLEDHFGVEHIEASHAFNDLWRDDNNNLLILGSAQSGGSCIHILNPTEAEWKTALSDLNPPGKIAEMEGNTAACRSRIGQFVRPSWERSPLNVYLTENGVSENFNPAYETPVSLKYYWSNTAQNPEDWNRAAMENAFYRDRRDGRRYYTKTYYEIRDEIIPLYSGRLGVSYWAGHGNDPYYYSKETTKSIMDGGRGKKSVMVWPELQSTSTDFEWCLNDLFFPLAEHAQGMNANLYLRNKDVFWQSTVYTHWWSDVRSGKYADVFVPSLEETSSKTMEMSLAGRMGLWAAGAFDDWGARCVYDNQSYDRLRQFAHQQIPNQFMRNMVYAAASGARFMNNTIGHAEYMDLCWELIGSGALYVPKREEIVSFSPVHLSMKEPDADYLHHGTNVKPVGWYSEAFERGNSFVFGRLDGSWAGAPVTAWDFSRYAAGVTDRRLHFIPPYPNGMVLITPPQAGVFAEPEAPRGQLTDHLHPIYQEIMQEFITDGKSYCAADGTLTYPADSYYPTIAAAISNRAALLPITVAGDVAWVCAQSAPNHLRLTLVDSGYLNPAARTAKVSFHTVSPMSMTDVLDGTEFDVSGTSSVDVDVPLGLFRFIDIELAEPLTSNKEPAFNMSVLDAADAACNAIYSTSLSGLAMDDDPGSVLTFSKRSGPSWLHVDADGAVYGAPSVEDEGLNVFRVMVEDQFGAYDTLYMNVDVVPFGPAVDSLYPEADTFVRDREYSDDNFGADLTFMVKAGSPGYVRQAYLKFDLSSLSGAVFDRAVLRLKVDSIDTTSDMLSAYFLQDDDWQEMTLTWDNAPSAGSLLATAPHVPAGSWMELDITDRVAAEAAGDGMLSLRLVTGANNGVRYHAREAASGNRPELQIQRAAVPSGWVDYVVTHGLSGGSHTDFDGDGQSDIVEYGLGGDATNHAVQAETPQLILQADDTALFLYRERTNSNRGISYLAEWTESLVTGTWSSAWDTTTNYGSGEPEFYTTGKQLNEADEKQLFFRLQITNP